jgi:hypothetical protein
MRIDFFSPISNFEDRHAFVKRLQHDEDITLSCEIGSSGGKIDRVNSFTISANQMSQMQLSDDLFGLANSTYVSREQMSKLSSKIFSQMSILEEYQMPEYQFKESFIEDFIKQTAEVFFKQINLNDALATISKYSINFADDLRSDTIKADGGKVFKLTTYNNKSHIVVDNEGLDYLKKKDTTSTAGSGGASVLGLFSVGASAAKVKERENEWLTTNKDVNDELLELNTISIDENQWEFEGEKIVPKSLNVARLIKSKFSNTLTFSKVKKVIIEAKYTKKFKLYTKRTTIQASVTQIMNDLITDIDSRLQNNFNSVNNILNKNRNDINEVTNRLNINRNDINEMTNRLNWHINDHQIHTRWVVEEGWYGYSHREPYWGWNHGVPFHVMGHYSETLTILFINKFARPPAVIISPCRLDVSRGDNLRLDIVPHTVTTTSFLIKASGGYPTWGNTLMYQVRICWTAIGVQG